MVAIGTVDCSSGYSTGGKDRLLLLRYILLLLLWSLCILSLLS